MSHPGIASHWIVIPVSDRRSVRVRWAVDDDDLVLLTVARRVGALEACPFSAGTLAALTLFDVIEHVWAPLEFLAAARRPLKTGGLLVITTPDAGSWKAKIKRRFWRYFEFDRYLHLYHFSARTLALVMEKSGLQVTHRFRKRDTPLFVTARKI